MKRPTLWQWLRYAYGAGLPASLSPWVFHDTTGKRWVSRHVARSLLQLTPLIAAILIFVPGPFWIRGLATLGGVIMGLIFSVGYMIETTEHRLVKAGYPAGIGERTREARTTEARRIETARRRERIATRVERRRRTESIRQRRT
jgi:hypothetical protein